MAAEGKSAAVATIVPVSPATQERLEAYAALLQTWQRIKNLVAPATLDHLWQRHMADSAQLVKIMPQARRWLDLGSGAGFPGLVTAILLSDDPETSVTLVEANARKSAFLRSVIRELSLPAVVMTARIEALAASPPFMARKFDAISARALAPLDQLLGYAAPWLRRGARGVFHKGENFAQEYAKAREAWDFHLNEHPSMVEKSGRIVVIEELTPRLPAQA